MESFSKSRKANQNLYNPPFPLALENLHSQNPSPVEYTDSSRASRNSRIDASNSSISGRRTSVRRRPSSRLNDAYLVRSSPIPAVLHQAPQPTGILATVNDIYNGSVATSKGMRPPASPVPKQLSPRGTVRSSLMKRLTRRLQSPQPLEEDDPASLPIQRVPSTRRRSIRVSSTHRTSRRISARNSGLRSPSARLSRTPSGTGSPGYTNNSRSPSVLFGAIGSAALQDHSDYTTDSEQEEQPITMRSPRMERARATALASVFPPNKEMAVVPLDPVADLIQQITGHIDGRISRDTLSSAYDFSLNDYCNAFPAPPTPGTAPGPSWAADSNYTEPPIDLSPLANPAEDASSTLPTDRAPILRTLTSHPSLGASNAELKLELTLRASASWDNWLTWPSSTPASGQAGPPLVVARLSTAETQIVVTTAERHQSISTQVSIASSGPPSPAFPATPPIARPRSLDPLSQARRKTRIVCGKVIDNAENDDEFPGEITTGHTPDHFSVAASVEDGIHASTSRIGSDRSSLTSSFGIPLTGTHGASASIVSSYNAYSLNSPSDDDESTNVGVALTTEFRELASPSPISFSEQEDTRLTLYARRKGRKPEFAALNQSLRVNPPPLLSPSSKMPSSAVSSLATSLSPGDSGTFEGGIVTPNVQNAFIIGRAIPMQPSKQAKRKSFFRYPFSSKRSTGSLKAAHMPTNVQGAPPLASPRAKDLPMSATANKLDFSPKEVSNDRRQPSAVPVQPSAHPIRYPTSRFISFSRPSSSRGKVPVETAFPG